MRRILAMTMAAAAITAATSRHDAAQAQYVEGNHQVRAGFFIAPGNVSYDITDLGGPTTVHGSGSGVGFGASGGLEWIRAGSMTWGVELDIGTANGSKIFAATAPPIKASADYAASIRGRLGFYARPDLVLYGTVGVGAIGTEIAHTTGAGNLPKTSKTNIGVVYGAGIEYHRGATILYAEYLRGDYGSQTATITSGLTTYDYRYSVDQNLFRLGVKFKVGHDWKDDHRHPQHHQPMK